MSSECQLCAARSGIHDLTRNCCCLRLIRATPPHGGRGAMWAHLNASLTPERWAEVRQAAENAGLIRRREPVALPLPLE